MAQDLSPASRRSDRHRSRVDIAYDILVSARGEGSKKTHILYRANVSSMQAESYFSALQAHNLLEHAKDIDGNDVFRTTERGTRFIDCCEELKSLLSPVMNSRRMGPLSEFRTQEKKR